MLSSQNSGKYLSGKWHEDREKACRDTAYFSSSDLTFLGMDGTLEGPIGKLDRLDRTMTMKTQPVDPNNWEQDDYDWRYENPAVGG